MSHPQSYRFVVVWRAEAREIEGAEEVRRGWVEQVPDPLATEAGETERVRLGFRKLDELPALIDRMIHRGRVPPAAAAE